MKHVLRRLFTNDVLLDFLLREVSQAKVVLESRVFVTSVGNRLQYSDQLLFIVHQKAGIYVSLFIVRVPRVKKNRTKCFVIRRLLISFCLLLIFERVQIG